MSMAIGAVSTWGMLHTDLHARAGSVSVFGVGIGIRYFEIPRYSVSVSVTDPGLLHAAGFLRRHSTSAHERRSKL